MGIVAKLVVLGLIAVITVALFRAIFIYKPLPPPKPCIESPAHQRISLQADPKIIERFVGALNIPSLSYKVHEYDGPQMLRLIEYIEKSKLSA